MKVEKRTLLTIDDLLKFCQENKLYNFSSTEHGYKLKVQVPATFEIDDNVDDAHRGMMKLKIRIFHTGLNRNKSFVSQEAAEAAMPTIKNRPVLAAIHQLDNGEWDFEGHNFEVVKEENGKEEIRYIEHQVGSFDESDPFFEYDEELDKTYVCSYAYISEEYTKAAEIIRRKNGTKNSCELSIEKFSYNAKENYLDLEAFYVEGSTLLGSRADGTEIGEGMLGSRADIADFSEENNSVKFTINEELLKEIKKLNENLSHFNINPENLEEGGKSVKFEELLEKYGKTVEDITFEYENLSEEELEAKFAEVFGEEDTEGEGEADPEPTSDGDGENEEFEEEEFEEKDDESDPEEFEESGEPEEEPEKETASLKPSKYTITMSDGSIKEFELSLGDISCALNNLVNDTYAENDNTWYFVSTYPDNSYVIMEDFWSGKAYKQSYKREEDNFSLVGDRVEVYANYLTREEEEAIAELRSNYSVIESQLKDYQEKEETAKKDALFVSEDYSSISDKEEFKSLAENHKDFSLDELKNKLDDIILDYAKKGSLSFSVDSEKKTTKLNLPIQTKNKKGRYGSLKFN